MNMNMLTKMFTRLVMRKAMNWGINKGIDTVSRARKPKTASLPPQVDDDGNVIEAPRQGNDAQNRKQAKDMAKKVRTMNRMTRR